MAAWRGLAATRPNVAFFDSAVGNLITSLADADLVVSDVSAVVLQFLATDRPVVRLVKLSAGISSGRV